MSSRRTLDELLDQARARIERLEPADAWVAAQAGALLIDIRSDADRERDGIVPGSLHIPRTVLEWRVATDSSSRNPSVGGLDRQLVLVCNHGFSSSLAAATLVELGFVRTGDVVGGFQAWCEAGLPTIECAARQRQPDELPGMGPPDAAASSD